MTPDELAAIRAKVEKRRLSAPSRRRLRPEERDCDVLLAHVEELEARLAADREVYHQVYMVLDAAGTDKYLGALEQAQALVARLAACERANAELNVEVSRLYSCRNELQEVTAAVDDPSVNNTRTLADAVRGFKARLAACERDAERYRWLRCGAEVVILRNVAQYKTDRCNLVQTRFISPDELDAAIDAAKEGGE